MPGRLRAVQRAVRIAVQTRSGVAGSSICSTPNSASASTIALATAASPGVIPPSLPPRIPKGFVVDGNLADLGVESRQ